MKKLVLVESPTKVKSLSKYLGKDYTVLATFGHVRDLPSKQGSVRPEENFACTWEVMDRGEKALREIVKAMKGMDGLVLASDPDREGEAIAWHVLEYLKEKNVLKNATVERVSFNAITKSAILEAMKKPRQVNQELVEAYLARLSLDYLVGFTLSPVLWRKLPGSRSAGRVQSVALRLVVEREREIEAFVPQEYWTVHGAFQKAGASPFAANLVVLEGKKLEKFSLPDEASASQAVETARGTPYTVASVDKKRVRRNPQPPFTTSTLQQEASRKLGMSASRAMTLAQKLYEGIEIDGETTGLITYIRTDSVQVTPEGVTECRDRIRALFGDAYVPEAPRVYKTKAKNAQEAHEAIRPTDLARRPEDVARVLDPAALALYELVWKRMMASQMASAEFDQTTVTLDHPQKKAAFRTTGSIMIFDGFLKLYRESVDEGAEEEDSAEQRLPLLQVGDGVACDNLTKDQHITQPPPRYTEASLVKRMEELGIGRPSTYARIMQVLKDRDYVVFDKRQMVPSELGHLVTSFLKQYFPRYVEYDFTANLENQLDEISGGGLSRETVLKAFWESFDVNIKESLTLKIADILATLEKDLAFHLFRGKDRTCPECHEGQLELRLGKFGAFLGCSRYPTCNRIQPLNGVAGGPEGLAGDGEGTGPSPSQFPKILGTDPQADLVVSIRLGPYGLYLQWGEGAKPKRVSLQKGVDVDAMTLEDALQFGCLPRPLGVHPETELPLVAGLGRFGPYIKHGDKFVSIKDMDMILKGSLDEVVQALAAKAQAPSRFRRPAGTGIPASRTQKTVSKPKAPTRATASKKSASKAPAKASSKSKTGSQA